MCKLSGKSLIYNIKCLTKLKAKTKVWKKKAKKFQVRDKELATL